MNELVNELWSPTGMGVEFEIGGMTGRVDVVRAHTRKVCAGCQKRRVCFAMAVTIAPIGNPETPWRCGTCSRLRT